MWYRAVAKCDRVLVMDCGSVVDVGTVKELRTRPGWFAANWISQGCAVMPKRTDTPKEQAD